MKCLLSYNRTACSRSDLDGKEEIKNMLYWAYE